MTTLCAELQTLIDQITDARAARQLLRITGAGSKDFYGQTLTGTPLSSKAHRGIDTYEPSELFITAKSGTPITDIQQALAEHKQYLPFDPPRFNNDTLGGLVATGLSGPLAFRNLTLRQAVLGMELIDGQGNLMQFGGQVIKNVAGYDVPRFMVGALGTMALITRVTLRVAPLPTHELTLSWPCTQAEALKQMALWRSSQLPIKAAGWWSSATDDGQHYVRLFGTAQTLRTCQSTLAQHYPLTACDATVWQPLRDLSLAQLQITAPSQILWRIDVPSQTPELTGLSGQWAYDQAGDTRWLLSSDTPTAVRAQVSGHRGCATLVRSSANIKQTVDVFQPLSPALAQLHQRLIATLDPDGVFGQARLRLL